MLSFFYKQLRKWSMQVKATMYIPATDPVVSAIYEDILVF